MRRINIKDTIIIGILFFLILLPIGSMILNLDLEEFAILVKDSSTLVYIKNSVLSSLVSTSISLILAFFISYEVTFTQKKLNKIVENILILAMMIPSISVSIGLMNLLGNSGIITSLLGLDYNILGKTGVIVSFIIYTLPISYIMISNGMNSLDRDIYIAADTLNISDRGKFFEISLKSMVSTIILTFFTVFTITFTDYGIPMSIGGKYKTLSLYMYEEVIGMYNHSKGYMISIFLFIPSILTYIYDINKREVGHGLNLKNRYNYIKENNKYIQVIMIIISLIISLLFISFFMLLFLENFPYDIKFTFKNLLYIKRYKLNKFLINSILIAFFTSSLGIGLAFVSAYIVEKNENKLVSYIINSINTLTLTIPGLVLGLSYLYFYKASRLYGSYIILILVNMVHFMGTPYLMFRGSLSKIDRNYENIISINNIPKISYILDILVPILRNTFIEGFIYFFNNSMVTISAITFLFVQKTKPISLEMNTFINAQMNYEGIALVSILILFINIIVRLIGNILKDKKELVDD